MGETHLEAGHGRPGCGDERWESRPEELVSSLSSRQTVLAAPPTWWLTERELPGWFGLDVERHKLQCPWRTGNKIKNATRSSLAWRTTDGGWNREDVVVFARDPDCEMSAAPRLAPNKKESTAWGRVREQSDEVVSMEDRRRKRGKGRGGVWSWSSVESQDSQDSNGHDLQSTDPPWASDGAIPTADGPIRAHVCALTRGPKDPHGRDRLQRACLTTTWSAWDAVSFFY